MNLQHRVQGAKDEAAKHPGMTIAGVFNHVETPQDATAEVVRVNNAYPDIQGWAFIGGWPLFAPSVPPDAAGAGQKIFSVDQLPVERADGGQGVGPVLPAPRA